MSAIIYREGDKWIAQGVECDVCVQANRLGELRGRFEVAMRLEALEPGGLARIGHSTGEPAEYWHPPSTSGA